MSALKSDNPCRKQREELRVKMATAKATLMPVARTISFSDASSISKVSQCNLSEGEVFKLTPEAVRSSIGLTLGFPYAFVPGHINGN